MTSPADVAHLDQLTAASVAAHTRLHGMVAGPVFTMDPPEWFRRRIDRHNAVTRTHGSHFCAHLAATARRAGPGPAVVTHIATWLPGCAVCDRCGIDLLMGAVTVDREGAVRPMADSLPVGHMVDCDRCGGDLFDPTDPDPFIQPGVLQVGPIICYFVMCPPCILADCTPEGDTP